MKRVSSNVDLNMSRVSCETRDSIISVSGMVDMFCRLPATLIISSEVKKIITFCRDAGKG